MGSDGKESACNAGDLGSILGFQKDPLEKRMATHSSILAWGIPMDRGAWQAIYSPWGHKESDMSEQLSIAQSLYNIVLISAEQQH